MKLSAETCNVLLIESRKLLREGLCALLDGREGIRVVGEADDCAAAPELVRTLGVDVIVLNVIPPQQGSVEQVRPLVRQVPGVRILALMVDPGPQLLRE